ncbi:MAG: ankyrin repeat domain-containing protein, partial [Pseudomonadota bacterium]|nr:ankyrin repeat domain-containing protein [Pseudomonadota bacterium]
MGVSMYRLLLLSLLCFNTIAALAKTPREATRAMLRLMPSNKDFLPQLKQLVAAGADLQAVDKQGMNILHRIALWHGQDNAEAAAYLVDQLHTDYANWHETPLFLAIYSDNLEVVRVLADHYDFDQAYDNTSYPLLHALKYNSHNVAKFLLTRGVNVEIQNKHGHTPLHIARGLEIVSLLLDKGLDVNAVTNSGMTPLHIAMSYNDLAVIELLLASGANPDSKGGRSGMSPLHYAKSPAAVELILAAGGDVNISSSKHKLRPAHTVSNVDTLKALALNGANLNAQDVNGGTPLDQAVLSGKSSNLINALQIYGAAHSRQGYAQVRAMAAANTKPRDDHPKQEGKPKQQEQQDDEHDEHNDELDYLLNLNEVARKQSSNPVIGRTLETEQVLNTLKRKFMRGAV